MRTKSRQITTAVLATVIVATMGACGGDANTSGSTSAAPDVAPSATVDDVDSTPTDASSRPAIDTPVDATLSVPPVSSVPPDSMGEGSGTDPCALLTASVAAEALGVAVGEPMSQPGEGNATCSYHPADSSAKGLIYLTTYSVTGTQAVLEEAAKLFPDAKPVDGLGDAAQVSVQGQAIGVLSGETVFALGLVLQSPDGQLLPVDEERLVASARAVLDGR